MISAPYAVPKRGESRDGSWFGSEDGAAAILFSNSVRTPRPREAREGSFWSDGETRFWCLLTRRRIVPSASSKISCTRSRGRSIGSGGSPVPLSSAVTSTQNMFRGRDTRTTRAADSSRSGSTRVVSSCGTRGGQNLCAGHRRIRDRSHGFFRRSRGVGLRLGGPFRFRVSERPRLSGVLVQDSSEFGGATSRYGGPRVVVPPR